MTMIDAQVHFLEERLVLVHIPLELYPYFFKPVLRLIFDEIAPLEESEKGEDDENDVDDDGLLQDIEDASDPGTDYRQPAFLNVSITPVEVSVICPRRLAEKYFEPLMNQLSQVDTSLRSRLDVSENDYIAMQVLGQGLEAGKRVLELTSPLAMAGISIFFISTYFSDYIIVPLHSKASVISALENRGFQFENATAAFVTPLSPTSPCTERKLSDMVPPVTPPPSTLAELQTRTFENLRKRQILPSVDDSLRLVQCAAHHQYNAQESSMCILRDALTTVLLVDEPRFLSLTLAALDPAASLLLEKRLLPRFARQSASRDFEDGSGLLLGSKEDYLIPITLDLRDLSLEASGIVCGVAGRLADATNSTARGGSGDASRVSSNDGVIGSVPKLFDTFGTQLAFGAHKKSTLQHQLAPTTHHLKPDVDPSADAVEISFLSTARAGTIIVGEDELRRAIDALEAEKAQDSPGDPVKNDSHILTATEDSTI
ncbi:hypothetical protein N7462_003642 [Penicillium macrosclerotiorum]|uniref:uncharacterized protein n=1 Tax=Penicillium macrosclerotiorum TaxID=303699 RepID=UPI0025472675|nr:uncharacterized protein N7462_003642 [Penicillium macrosclerotiorum]KAJ5689250.1 hypothetical protein N7462_003642 [Penicillium macrosclerotiorum]